MNWNKVESDLEKGPLGAFKWVVIATLLLFLLFGLLSALGKIGGTTVDRAVMKTSFQYKEGMEQRAAILQASIAEIDIRLQSNPDNRQDLQNQRAILSAQLNAITINE